MKRPVLVVDTQTSVVVATNEAAAELLGGKPASALAGMGLGQLLPGLGSDRADQRPKWMRFADGKRRWMSPLSFDLPGNDGRFVLVLQDAGLSTLEAQACPELRNAVDALDDDGPAADAWQRLCNILVRSLDLALARIVTADEEAREIAVAGGRTIADAVRQLTRVPDVAAEADENSLRQPLPTLTRVKSRQRGCHPSLVSLGVRSAEAWPLAHSPQSCVIELYAYGRDDLEDPPTAEFLSKWLASINGRFAQRDQRQRQRLLADALAEAVTPAFIADHEGVIVWVNAAFSRQYGYAPEDAIGKTPRILQSGEHGERYYRGLWASILGGHAWSGRTVDRAVDGRLFVVRQSITPLRRHGRVTHFLAIHSDITEDSELASIADTCRSDALTGLMTWAAFREYGREALLTAGFTGLKWTFTLIGVTSGTGQAPGLTPEALASIYGELGERIRSLLPDDGAAASLGNFDFALLLPQHMVTADLVAAITAAIAAPLPLLGDTLELACRVARADFPADGASVDELRKAADRQLAARLDRGETATKSA